jgi:hypothetical protein
MKAFRAALYLSLLPLALSKLSLQAYAFHRCPESNPALQTGLRISAAVEVDRPPKHARGIRARLEDGDPSVKWAFAHGWRRSADDARAA